MQQHPRRARSPAPLRSRNAHANQRIIATNPSLSSIPPLSQKASFGGPDMGSAYIQDLQSYDAAGPHKNRPTPMALEKNRPKKQKNPGVRPGFRITIAFATPKKRLRGRPQFQQAGTHVTLNLETGKFALNLFIQLNCSVLVIDGLVVFSQSHHGSDFGDRGRRVID